MLTKSARAIRRYSRLEIADQIVQRLSGVVAVAQREFHEPGRIASFSVDHLLPEEMVSDICSAFPAKDDLVLKKTLGQLKYVGYELKKYDPVIEEIIYAFQDSRVVQLVGAITGMSGLLPDDNLYAGGISLMEKGHYLNPHLDNSHDKDRKLYRVLNLLFYVTPDWREENGGNLELWDKGPGEKQRTITSKFNRLIVMQTDEASWHSVSEVQADRERCCVSNYYFSERPAGQDWSYHVTSFRGWPRQKALDLAMRFDSALRLAVRKVGGNRLFKNPHVYKK